MTDLPDGWIRASLGDVVEIIRGVTYDKADARAAAADGLIPILRANNIMDDGLAFDDLVFVPNKCVSAAQMLRGGDIVMAASSGSRKVVGKSGRLTSDWRGSFGAFCYVIRPREGVDATFIAHFMRTPEYRNRVSELAAGVNINNLRREHIAQQTLGIPPLNEQRRIVAKLDVVFEQTRAAKIRLDRLPALLAKLKRSILAGAFRGELTADWRAANPNVEPAKALLDRVRADHRHNWEVGMRAKGKVPSPSAYRPPTALDFEAHGEVPPGWTWASVDDLAELQLGQQRAPIHARAEKTHPYVRAANINWEGLDLSDVKAMGFPDPERYRLRYGDVLLNEASGSPSEVGKPAIWRDEIPGCCYQKTLLRARPRGDVVTSEWLHAAFLADALLGRFARMAPGVGILHLTADRMLRWPVPLAPVEEQNAIVKRLRSALAAISRLEQLVADAHQKTERLEQAALAKAFRGELLEQDPGDVPASPSETVRRSSSEVKNRRSASV